MEKTGIAAAGKKAPVVDTVGVGIVLKPSFQSETFLALVVHSLVPGSSADLSNMIRVRQPRGTLPHATAAPALAVANGEAARVLLQLTPLAFCVWQQRVLAHLNGT